MSRMGRKFRDADFGRQVGERLQQLLDEREQTQMDLSFATQIAASQINRWCRGASTPSPDFVVVLCRYFDVSADWLLGLSSHRRSLTIHADTDVDAMADELAASEPPQRG